MTDEIVDKQLDDLKRECLSYETRDVAKFMEKLKTQSESIDGGDGSQDEKKADIVMLEKKSTRRESESKKELEMIAKQKELKSESLEKRKGSESSNHVQVRRKSSPSPSTRKPKTIDMDTLSPKPQDVDISSVQIIKIKSPGGSRKSSRETSRNNSIERSPSKERQQQQQQQQTLKKPEGGILKKPSPKFGKASEYKLSNSLRPDSFISPFSSFESKSDKLSPSSEILPAICSQKDTQKRASFSDYERDPQDYHHQAMKSRSLEGSLEHLKSALKHQSSYEQYGSSPIHAGNDSHKYYSLSAQHSIESNRSPVRYCSPIPPHYYNEPFYEYPRQKTRNRESRSLERPDFSRQSSSEYERYYEEPPYPQHYSQQQKNQQEQEQQQRHRRHSVYEHRSIPYHYYSMSPDDYLMSSSSHYEQPSACVDCYYQTYRQPSHSHYIQQPPPLPQRNPSSSQQQQQQQHHQQPQQSKSPSQSRQRQSRSRKKLSRRMSSNYFNKSFDDDDTQNATIGKQSNDNEEIRV